MKLATIAGNGLVIDVKLPEYGLQAQGITPGGPADELAFLIAYILLGRPEIYQCLEIIFAPREINFNQDVVFCLSGAGFPSSKLIRNNQQIMIEHGVVNHGKAGDKLLLSGIRGGLRSYLLMMPFCKDNIALLGRRRGDLRQWFNPYSRQIQVAAGPEFDYLVNPTQLLSQPWQIDKRSNAMGMRLNGEKISLTSYDIISAPVCDGTVQITADGPIILLRQRQTTGGYPRAIVVCHESLNHLAQLASGESITFQLIEHTEAVERQNEYYQRLQQYEKFLISAANC